MNELKVCYYGDYDQNYPRNKVLLKGLLMNGVKPIICNEKYIKRNSIIGKFFNILKINIKLITKIQKSNYDRIFIAYPVIRSIWFPKLLNRQKPIIIDPFYSYYNTIIFDHKLFEKNPLISKLISNIIYQFDKEIFKTGDLIIADTKIHAIFFSKIFDIPISKFRVVYIGADNFLHYPLPMIKKENFIVNFIGNYIPLQGIDYIVDAAKFLSKYKNIYFEIVGGNFNNSLFRHIYYRVKEEKLKNIKLIQKVPSEQVPQIIQRSDIQLGIFGKSLKAQIVIPNKIYEAIAMKKPIITGNSIAIKELFKDGYNSLLVDIKNPEDLAQKILKLYQDGQLRDNIANNGYRTYLDCCTPDIIGKQFINILKDIK